MYLLIMFCIANINLQSKYLLKLNNKQMKTASFYFSSIWAGPAALPPLTKTFNGCTNTALIDWQRSIISASLCSIDSLGEISIFSLALCPAGHVTCSDPAMDTNGTYISRTAPNVTCQTGTRRMGSREWFGVNTHTHRHTHWSTY